MSSGRWSSAFCSTTNLLLQSSTSNLCSLHAYSDADWAGCPNDWRIAGGCGCIIFLGKNMTSWFAREQNTMAKSSTKVEYRAMVDTAT